MAAKGKPKTTRAKPAPKVKPAPKAKKPETTVEDLLGRIGPALDAIDTFMADRPVVPKWDQRQLMWSPHHAHGTVLHKLFTPVVALGQQLDELSRGRLGNADKPSAEELIRERFATKPGEPLSWSRPGSFLCWIDDIPVRAEWGGFVCRMDHGLYALDARRLFVDAWGHRSVQVHSVPFDMRTPEQLMRQHLASEVKVDRYSKSSPLVVLSARGREAVREFLADPVNAYWVEAVQQPPVEPVSLPVNLPAVQTSLFS